MDPHKIAAKLTRGQQTCIRNLDAEPAWLGCSEPWAFRLAKGGPRRPPLVQIATERSSDGYQMFSLNDLGLQVKAALGLG